MLLCNYRSVVSTTYMFDDLKIYFSIEKRKMYSWQRCQLYTFAFPPKMIRQDCSTCKLSKLFKNTNHYSWDDCLNLNGVRVCLSIQKTLFSVRQSNPSVFRTEVKVKSIFNWTQMCWFLAGSWCWRCDFQSATEKFRNNMYVYSKYIQQSLSLSVEEILP